MDFRFLNVVVKFEGPSVYCHSLFVLGILNLKNNKLSKYLGVCN